jgi:hypothetical protein
MNRLKKVTGVGLVIAAAVSILAVGTGSAAPRATQLDTQLAAARTATAKYVDDLALAKKNGYEIITRMIPSMGYHFMNPAVKGFDITKPPILVYVHQGSQWQLGAIEWVFTSKPKSPPLPGARYGAFGAGCHYADGTYVPATSQAACPPKAPGTGAKFGFWHPNLVTMHVWLWDPNPNGLYASTNPRVSPFDLGGSSPSSVPGNAYGWATNIG